MTESGIFRQAVKLHGAERDKFLEEACGSNASLRQDLESLLRAHETIGDFLAEPPIKFESTKGDGNWNDAVPGAVFGPYRLIEPIGQGGMGSVWRAEQTAPVRREVAIKFIRTNANSRTILARFEAERQALAIMSHPNIATVLDAGITPANAPYFVMELVKGIPITAFCDAHRLSLRQRLQLFVSVCRAIQHAHQKGVIHRDIKPSNVLVAMYDGQPVPKVIDFGLAKATGEQLADVTALTGAGVILGTPEYMSPEQANLKDRDVDTRSDVYALGVLLYELITGTTPVDRRSLGQAALLEILRIVCEDEPPLPSAKLSDSDALPSIAANRGTEPAKLSRMIRGDLDWVVMKALEKDRNRRYDSASGLARDLERYLADEVVEARPPSALYRLHKFIRRHRSQSAAAAVAVTALIVGSVGASVGMIRALRAEKETRLQRDAARQAADAEAKRSRELQVVSDFQSKMLSQLNATRAGVELINDLREKHRAAIGKRPIGDEDRQRRSEAFAAELKEINATDAASAMMDRTILKPAVAALDREFKDQPTVDASLRQTLALLQRSLGRFAEAAELQRQAMETRRRVLGEDHADTIRSIGRMAQILHLQGKYGEAEPYFRESVERSRRVFGQDHEDTLSAVNDAALFLESRGKLTEAETLLKEVLDRRMNRYGPDHAATLTSINNLAFVLQRAQKLEAAESYYREGLAASRRTLGDEHEDTLQAINNLGAAAASLGKLDEAESLYREALEKRRRVLGEEHPGTITPMINLAGLLRRREKWPESERQARAALATARRALGNAHPKTTAAMGILTDALIALKQWDEAESLAREATRLQQSALGDKDARVGSMRLRLGTVLLQLRKFADSEVELLAAQRVLSVAEGVAPRQRSDCVKTLAALYEEWEKSDPGKGHGAKGIEWKSKAIANP